MKLQGDNPIRCAEEDLLGRAPVAESFVRSVLALDVSEGAVVGVLGPWGSGKTSFVNLARSTLAREGIDVLDFNPWMFSGSEQLVQSFFVELAAQMKLRRGFGEIADILQEYGEAFSGLGWLPVVGSWIERVRVAAGILAKALKRRQKSVDTQRRRLCEALAQLEKPICVVLDDIDRLTSSEIRDIFRLVRLTAGFPNIIYVVAFDRFRVEGALREDGITGRDYIEKILLLVVDLPCLQDQVLITQFLGAVSEVVSLVEGPGPLDQSTWPDVFAEVIRPLVRNMRDVRRYAAALHWTLGSIGGQISLVDALALEAVRVFLPDVFGRLHCAVEALTSTTDDLRGSQAEIERLKTDVLALVEAAGLRGNVVKALIDRVFPAAKQHVGTGNYGSDWKVDWLKERRAAHRDVLRLYLEHTAGAELRARWAAEVAFSLLENPEKLDTYLRSLDVQRLPDVIASLEAFESDFSPMQVVPGTVVLLNLIGKLPDRIRGLGDFGSRLTVVRVVLRLLRSLDDSTAVEAAVRQALPRLDSLSTKLELVRMVGYRKNVGLKLVSTSAAGVLEREWRDDVRCATVDDLAAENDAAKVLLVARKGLTTTEGAIDLPDDPRLTLAILKDVRSEAVGQTVGSRAVTREPRLAWNALVELYGDERTVRARVDDLKDATLPDPEDVIQLAEKYLDGWRPDD